MQKRHKYKPRQQQARKPRINHQIRASEVQVIDSEGKQLGTIKTSDALKLAHEDGLDLVEISPTTNPPVTKILDFGRYMYEKGKSEKSSKANRQPSNEIKAVRITFRAGQHDLGIRAKQADKFLTKGHRVKIDLKLRGREKGMVALAKEKFDTFFKLLEIPHVIEGPVKKSPFGLSVLIKKQ